MQKTKIDDKFGAWTVLDPKLADIPKPRKGYFFCECSCGVSKWVNGGSLRQGKSVSCGCQSSVNAKKTFRKKYGVDNPSQSEEIKAKKIATSLKNYGVENASQADSIKSKKTQTSLANYGVENPSQSEEIKKKKIASSLEKYGCVNPSMHPDVIQKNKDTCLERYGDGGSQAIAREAYRDKSGFDSPFHDTEVQDRVKETVMERYGYENTLSMHHGKPVAYLSDGRKLFDVLHEKFGESKTFAYSVYYEHGETALLEYIENYDGPANYIESFLDKRLSEYLNRDSLYWNKKVTKALGYKPDLKVNSDLYINIDGLYWHSEKYMKNDYHVNLRKSMESIGKEILQFRSDEIFGKTDIILSMVKNKLGLSERLYARKCSISEISPKDAKSFLDTNHLMGSGGFVSGFGLYHEGSLVAVATFKVRAGVMELFRFCTKSGVSVVGGLGKLLKAAVSKHDVKKVYSFVDLRYGNGNSLLKLGFTKTGETLGWRWTDGTNTYNRLKCIANMDDRLLPMREYAAELGWFKIFDAGQAKFVLEI